MCSDFDEIPPALSVLPTRSKSSKDDVDDVFRAVGDAVGSDTSNITVSDSIPKQSIAAMLSSAYDLDVDVDAVFSSGSKSAELSKDEMSQFLLAPATPI